MSSENDAEMSVYINHHSSSDADDNDDDDESHEFRVSDLQLTGFFHDMSTDPLSKSIVSNKIYLDEYSEIDIKLVNVDSLSDDRRGIQVR